jgi:hypothetical protein
MKKSAGRNRKIIVTTHQIIVLLGKIPYALRYALCLPTGRQALCGLLNRKGGLEYD